jgi:hypothetical protein
MAGRATRHGAVSRRPLWLVAALLLLVVQQFAVVPGSGRLTAGLQNALHGPWFALVTFVCYAILRALRGAANTLLLAGLTAVALALATEAVQVLTGGDAEWLDVGLDLLGAAAALLVLAARERRLPSRPAYGGAALLLLISLTPATFAIAVTWHRQAILPDLVDFSAPRFGGLLVSTSPLRVVDTPVRSLEITLADEDWPGVYLREPIPDWSGYEALVVDVSVPDDAAPLPLHVSIRLRSGEGDHVFRSFVLAAGPARLRLPLRELFDPGARSVAAVVVYSTREAAGRRFTIARIHLE